MREGGVRIFVLVAICLILVATVSLTHSLPTSSKRGILALDQDDDVPIEVRVRESASPRSSHHSLKTEESNNNNNNNNVFVRSSGLAPITHAVRKYNSRSDNSNSVEVEGTVLALNGAWQAVNSDGSIAVPATVPGQIQIDLLNAGVIDDPYYGYNDVLYRWIVMDDWSFSRSFQAPSNLTSHEKVYLVAEGLDTVGNVTLNGAFVGSVNNMFRRYMFDVTDVVVEGYNKIEIAFVSAARYAAEQEASYVWYYLPTADNEEVQNGEPYRNFIRKEQCSFSWDWGPCFAPQGIWKDIYLIGFDDAFISDVAPQLYQDEAEQWTVKVKTTLQSSASPNTTTEGFLTISIDDQDKQIPITLTSGENEVEVEVKMENDVNLWWPSSLPYQRYLYQLNVTFEGSTGGIWREERWVGFKTVELITEPIPEDPVGLSFYFQINGYPVFIKGANWVPADSFESRVTPQYLEGLMNSAVLANMNTLRNWGGGIYQQDAFYDIADDLGIMIWEEFMFACAMYPRDIAFLATVAEEVKYQVRRLSSHPSIIIWGGNNENEAALGWFNQTLTNRDLYLVDYAKLYMDTIWTVLVQYDTTRPWWHSSPSNGAVVNLPDLFVAMWGNPSSTAYGDLHFYDYEHDGWNQSSFPMPRFASEYGWQSFPSFQSWAQISSPSDWNQNSELVNHRQHHANGTQQIEAQMAMHFHMPNNTNTTLQFQHFIYLSQAIQAQYIKTESEHYRRLKNMVPVAGSGWTRGALYWQFNDIWQAPSWASIEYGGKWKMLHYYAADFFSPVLVSALESSYNNFSVYVTSDLLDTVYGYIEIEFVSWGTGDTLRMWNVTFSVPSDGSILAYNNFLPDMISGYEREDGFIMLKAVESTTQTVMSTNAYYLTYFNSIELKNPNITVTSASTPESLLEDELIRITLTSSSVAPFVMIESPFDNQGYWSDNGFLLLPNTPVQISFYPTNTSAISFEPLNEDALLSSITILSVYDTYH